MEKMYVLVRSDLTNIQQAVQAGHAIAEYLLAYKTSWDNGTLIYLQVGNETALRRWANKLDLRGVAWKGFVEPDMDNELTALASVGDGKIFRGLRLLK